MNRLDAAFQRRPIFMPYFPLGYPDLPTSVNAIEALAKNGADVVEIGLSFSDPLADGPVIQKATQVALRNGITVGRSLAAVRTLRERGVALPLILMGYYNPMLAFGLARFAREAIQAGADGFIVPDLPMEEAAEFESLVGDVPLIQMIAPTTPDERMATIAERAQGFIYLVSVTGTTGVRQSVTGGLEALIARVRKHARVPVCVGFGIGTPAQAEAVGAIADGIIVGSACVRSIGGSLDPTVTAARFARSFQEALQVKT